MTVLETFFASAAPFVEHFNDWTATSKPDAKADHICFKCSSSEEFERLRAMFESGSEFIYQSIISARRIAIVKFMKPITTSLGEIWFLELSDQKPDGSQTSGWDHIEMYPTSGTVEQLAEQLEAAGTVFEKVVRPHHTTYDAAITGTFKVRLENEALVDKIKTSEMQ